MLRLPDLTSQVAASSMDEPVSRDTRSPNSASGRRSTQRRRADQRRQRQNLARSRGLFEDSSRFVIAALVVGLVTVAGLMAVRNGHLARKAAPSGDGWNKAAIGNTEQPELWPDHESGTAPQPLKTAGLERLEHSSWTSQRSASKVSHDITTTPGRSGTPVGRAGDVPHVKPGINHPPAKTQLPISPGPQLVAPTDNASTNESDRIRQARISAQSSTTASPRSTRHTDHSGTTYPSTGTRGVVNTFSEPSSVPQLRDRHEPIGSGPH